LELNILLYSLSRKLEASIHLFFIRVVIFEVVDVVAVVVVVVAKFQPQKSLMKKSVIDYIHFWATLQKNCIHLPKGSLNKAFVNCKI
jgi:hypothetical protein